MKIEQKVFYHSSSKKVLIIFSFVFAVVISSCQREEIEPASVSDSRIERINNLSVSLYTPYADSLELAVFKSDNEIVSHNLIRKLAMIELSLEGFNRDMD